MTMTVRKLDTWDISFEKLSTLSKEHDLLDLLFMIYMRYDNNNIIENK